MGTNNEKRGGKEEEAAAAAKEDVFLFQVEMIREETTRQASVRPKDV